MSAAAVETFDPPICRDMTVLDRRRFAKIIKLAAAVVEPRKIGAFQQACSKDVLQQARLRSVYDRDGQKLIALRPDIRSNDQSKLSQDSRSYMDKEGVEIVDLDVELTYDYWKADTILAAILPESLVEDSPTGFSMVGHIAHMNLREAYLPYKHIIGQVILDKNTVVKTVVNKLDTIDSVYRNFQMEVIAGEEQFLTEHIESGCKFRFDFSKVYWNSRLHTEHDRLIQLFQPGQAVCDVMAGVGPFAIPAGKKKVIVFANDLNPASYASLEENISLNHVSDFVVASNLDGRQCIRESLQRLQDYRRPKKSIVVRPKSPPRKRPRGDVNSAGATPQEIEVPETFQHYVMNLPATAIEFLDAFRGLYYGQPETLALPKIHVHCFTKFEDEEAHQDMTQRISTAMGHSISSSEISFHQVRRVAPSKDMFCCSFILPREVAYLES